MKILYKSSENEMIALFLYEEIKSERYVKQIDEIIINEKIDRNIIYNPNFKNNKENQLRRIILEKFRGYGINKGIFENFPEIMDWNWAILEKEDILKIKYINYDYWEELSNGSRYAKDSIYNIRNNIEIFGVSNNGFISLSEYIKNGNKIDPLIIVAPFEKKDNMIVLEGHVRITAINLIIENITEIKVLLGFTNEEMLNKWNKY
jgi:hypothetical protein